jgi:nucleoside-diphosphate-sugar epimerase
VSVFSKRLLVTGASGFVGSRIVYLAREAGWHVRALYRDRQMQADGIEMFVGDISDPIFLGKACKGVSAVIHAAGLAHVVGSAAKDSTRFNEVNVDGTDNLVSAAMDSGVPRVVLVSSVSVYGSYSGTKCDETVPCNPQSAYAKSKLRGELRAAELMARAESSLSILRFATIYGEGDRGNVARLISTLDRGQFIWPGSGQNQKSLIYREDAARACLYALERSVSGTEIFNVSASPATMREIVIAICEGLGRRVPRFGISLSLLNAAGAISRRIGDPGQFEQRLQKFIRDDVYDGTKFETSFGFRPAVSLSEGLRREVESLRSRTKR